MSSGGLGDGSGFGSSSTYAGGEVLALNQEASSAVSSRPGGSRLARLLGIPDDPIGQRRQKYVDGLQFRAVAAACFLAAFCALQGIGLTDGRPLARALPYLLILGVINLAYWRVGRISHFGLQWFFVHWAVDIILISLTLITLGGLEVPYGLLAYVMIIVTSATFVSKRASFIVAVGAALATIAIGVLELALDVTPTAVWGGEMDAATKTASIVFALLFFFIFAYLAGTLADQLKVASHEVLVARNAIEEQNRQLETAVRRRTVELERRNAEVEEFVHVVTHDLRNVAVGVSELARRLLAREGPAMSTRGSRDVDRLLQDARRMNEMLSSLLAIFRVERDAQQAGFVDVGQIVASVVRSQAPRLERKAIQVRIEPLPAVKVDQSRLSHVIANVIDNAIKYVGDKPHPLIHVYGRSIPEGFQLCIADNGVGIDSDQLERIFQLYHRAPRQVVAGELQLGEGVGLAMCKRIVERWGGRIEVASVLGEGSCFSIVIPDREWLPHLESQ